MQTTGVPVLRSRVTIKDVAAKAGVSTSTVSHTFSGKRSISETTRQKVLKAAQELGYSADPTARSLRTRTSGMIGLVLRPRFASSGSAEESETFNRLAGSMATECLKRGIGLVHVPDPTRPDFTAIPMDGCIVAHPYASDPVIDHLIQRRVPLVLADADPDRPDLPWTIAIDYQSGFRDTLNQLNAGQGQTVWLLPGSEDNAWNRAAQGTFGDWCDQRQIHGQTHVLSESLSAEEARALVKRLLSEHGHPAAIALSVSKASRSLLQALQEEGLRVPADVEVVALTDSVLARTAPVPVTALDLNHEQLSTEAVDLMLRRLEGHEPPSAPLQVEPQLNRRASTR